MKKILFAVACCIMAISSLAQEKGRFEVHDFGNFKLHVYYSNDVMSDASYIVEGQNGLVAMEYPLFKVNAAEFDQYIKALGKPVELVITDYHEGGSGNLPQAMAEGMPEFMKGAIYGGMVENFKHAFGDSMVELPTGKAEEVPFGSTRNWVGVPFKFMHGPKSDFPAASILIGGKAYYTHWTPSKAHISPLQVSSAAAIDAEIADAENALKSGAELFIGGHGGAANADAVEFKVAYLKTIKKLLAENKTQESFIDAVKKAFPSLPGENNLPGLAKALYPAK